MFLIQNTLVSLDVLEKDFCCDLDKCRGCCCIEGDAGAPLTDEEIETIKSHPMIAAREILEPISGMNTVLPIIENHHENWDGSGYPNELSGDQIPLESQMILMIDAYYALQEPRSYRKAMEKEDAIEVIKSDIGKKWNPRLAEEFISIIETEDF